MGRNKKAKVNSVVEIHRPMYGTVVGYRDDVRSNRYQIVETDFWGRNPRGAGIWMNSDEFTPLGHRSRTAGRIARKNQAEPERGCDCQCCHHDTGFDVEG